MTWLCVPASFAPIARAETDSLDKSQARDLAYEGVTALEAGNTSSAVEQLERAYSTLRVPSVALWSARAFAQAGDLTRARERLQEALMLPTNEGSVQIQEAAVRDAHRELALLDRRIPRVEIRRTTDQANYIITLDGRELDPDVKAALALNPGIHKLHAVSDGVHYRLDFSLEEGEREVITLPALGASTGSTAPDAARDRKCPGPDCSDSPLRLWGWIGLGAGAAALVGAGIAASSASSDLERIRRDPRCDRDQCSAEATHLVDSYERARTWSTVGWIGGGLLTLTGATLLLWPTADRSEGISLGPQGVRFHSHF